MASKIDDWFIWVEANRDTPTRQWTEEVLPQAKAALLADMLELVGEDEIVYMASPPPILPVARNPHEIEEVRYQTNKLLFEAEVYKAAMVKHSLRQELRDKLKEYYGETNG